MRRQRTGFDVIYLHRASSAALYLALARQSGIRTRIVYGVGELNHLRLARQAKVEHRPDLLAQSHRMRVAEYTACVAADVVITHSAVEAAQLRQAVRGANVHVVPWAVPVRAPSALGSRTGIALIGDFGLAAIGDAAHFLCVEVMPLVWRERPDLACVIAGTRMAADIQRLAGTTIKIFPDFLDTRPILDRVRLTVAPLRFGAGVNDTVIDSLVAGIPCVTTPIGMEGIELPPALALVGSTSQELATLILRNYDSDDPAEVALTRQKVQAFMAAHYAEAVVQARLREAIDA